MVNTTYETFDPEKMKQGIHRREKQLDNLRLFTQMKERFYIQVNFSVPNSTDHCCVTLSGVKVDELADHVMELMDSQIKAMKRKLEEHEIQDEQE